MKQICFPFSFSKRPRFLFGGNFFLDIQIISCLKNPFCLFMNFLMKAAKGGQQSVLMNYFSPIVKRTISENSSISSLWKGKINIILFDSYIIGAKKSKIEEELKPSMFWWFFLVYHEWMNRRWSWFIGYFAHWIDGWREEGTKDGGETRDSKANCIFEAFFISIH